jgi:ribosomal protein L25 (general stress protein Ctc)
MDFCRWFTSIEISIIYHCKLENDNVERNQSTIMQMLKKETLNNAIITPKSKNASRVFN